MKLIIIIGVSFVVSAACERVTLTRCNLLKLLRRQDFPEIELRDWICLIESESGRSTNKIGIENSDGSRDYGLFQINDANYCSNTETPGKICNVTCDELLTDDITQAATCAKTIYNIQGFSAWDGWENRCQGSLPDVSDCPGDKF